MFYNVSSGSGVVIAHYSYMQVYKYFIVDVCCLECLPSILLMIVFLLALETASSTGTGVPMFLETKTTGLCWLAQCEHWDLNSASQSPSSIFFFFNWNWKKNHWISVGSLVLYCMDAECWYIYFCFSQLIFYPPVIVCVLVFPVSMPLQLRFIFPEYLTSLKVLHSIATF